MPRLTDSLEYALVDLYLAGDDGRILPRQSGDALVRRGLASVLRQFGGYTVYQITPAGRDLYNAELNARNDETPRRRKPRTEGEMARLRVAEDLRRAARRKLA